MPSEVTYGEFAWLLGGPHLEVGFLTELTKPHEDFLSNFLLVLNQTTPKVEIVSSATELDAAEKEFLTGYPWDSNDTKSFIVHAWDALARFRFKESRESLIKMHQISDTVVHVNFHFWGDVNDGWGQRGLKNDELPEFIVFLKSLGRLLKFEIGTIGFHTWTMFLFDTDEDWGHPSYSLKNLTREVIKRRANDPDYDFVYVIAKKDFFENGDGMPEEDGYFVMKMGYVLRGNDEAGGVGV